MKKALTPFLAAATLFVSNGNILPVAAITTAVTLSAAPSAKADPIDHRVARRTSRRTTRRVVRRHLYGLPGGAVAFHYHGYHYHRVGSIYYYPYFISGRTVYVQIDVDTSGQPLPPPPVTQVQVEIDL